MPPLAPSPSPTSTTFTQQPTHLIILCCHAIYVPASQQILLPSSTTLENNFLLSPFQASESSTFTTHLRTSLFLLSTNPSSLLVISGSKTRPELSLSEAASYLKLAEENAFWCKDNQQREDIKTRILLDEQALDSFSNVIYSMLSFWRRTSQWPTKISLVTHEFKRKRFLTHHVPTLGIPRECVDYVGINPEYMDASHETYAAVRSEEVRRAEAKKGLKAWEEDEWGRGEVLRGKRCGRNYWAAGQLLFTSQEERAKSALKTGIVRFEWGGKEVEEEYLKIGFRQIYSKIVF